jgi:hypothetical protein
MKGSTILQQVIKEIMSDPFIKENDNDLIVMNELCTKIQNQEMAKLNSDDNKIIEEHAPSGANIYLTLPVPYQKNVKEVSCITLQKDPLSGWAVCFHVDFGGTKSYKLKKRHDIEATKPNHIVTEFARIYKAYLGKETSNL